MDLILILDHTTLKLVHDELYQNYIQSSQKNKHNEKRAKELSASSLLSQITIDQFILAVMTVICPPELFSHSPHHTPQNAPTQFQFNDNDTSPHMSNNSINNQSGKGLSIQISTNVTIHDISNLSSPELSRSIHSLSNHQIPATSPKRTGTTVSYERRHHRLQQTVQALKRIFDLVDVDHQGYVSWVDITNYCIRAGNFAFRGSISQSLTNFTRIEGVPSSIITFPTRNLYYIPNLNFLCATDTVQSMIRYYKNANGVDGNSIRMHGIYHPHKEFTRKIMQAADNKPKTLSGSLIFQRAKQITATDDLFHGTKKKTILGIAYIERKKCMCLVTADRYLLTVAFRDAVDLLAREFLSNQYDIIRYQFTEHAQTGIVYSSSMDVIITWAGEDERCLIRMWHVEELSLLETVSIHKDRILDGCEVFSRVDRNYMVTCDNQAKVYLWSVKLQVSTISTATSSITKPLIKEVPISMQLRAEVPVIDVHNSDGVVEKYQLKGHTRSIRSLAFASQSGMVIGAGFDFEIFVWDPWTKLLVMKLVSHVSSISKVIVIYCPAERIVSADEDLVVKIWNISRDVVGFGELLQTIPIDSDISSARIADMSVAFDQGRVFAVQTDRLYFFTIDDDSTNQNIVVKGGLGYCPSSGAIFTVSESLLTLANIRSGKVVKRLFYADDHVSDISTSMIDITSAVKKKSYNYSSVAEEKKSTLKSKLPTPKSAATAEAMTNVNVNPCFKIDPNDQITSSTFDGTGKKLFVGTYHGRVYLYDSNTFGLLKDLTSFDDGYKETAGAVTAMSYSQRDSLLIVVYANGNLKAYNALFRNNLTMETSPGSPKRHHMDSHNVETRRRPPATPILLRSTSYVLAADFTINLLVVSEDTNTLAIANVHGTIWIYAYDTFILHNVFRVVPPTSVTAAEFKLTDIVFLDRLPVLMVTDSSGRITAFLTYPQEPLHIFSWNPSYCPHMNHFNSFMPSNTRASSRLTSPISAIEPSARLQEIKTMLVDKLSLPPNSTSSLSLNGDDDDNDDDMVAATMNVQRMIAQHSPTLSPTFAARHSKLQHVTIQMKNHGIHGVANTSSVASEGLESAVLDLKAHWYIFVINSMGRIIVQDITAVLVRAQLMPLLSYYDRDLGDMSVYNIINRLSPTDGCRQISTFDAVTAMLREPINNSSNPYFTAKHHITIRDVRTVAHWRINKEGVVSNTTATLAIPLSNLLFIPTTSLSEPYLIAAASEGGEVYLWCWNGKKLLGKWQDLHTRDQRRLDENDDDSRGSRSPTVGSANSSSTGGWCVSGNILVNPFNQNISTSKQSPTNKGSSQFHRFGSDWAAFLEEVHRRSLSKSEAMSLNQPVIPVIMSHSSPITRGLADQTIINKLQHRPKSALTRMPSSSIAMQQPTFMNAGRDEPIHTDYSTWREALTSTDDLVDDSDDDDRITTILAAELEELELKRQYALNRIISESAARKLATSLKSPLMSRRISNSTLSSSNPLPFSVHTGKGERLSVLLSPLPDISSYRRANPTNAEDGWDNISSFKPDISSPLRPDTTPILSPTFQPSPRNTEKQLKPPNRRPMSANNSIAMRRSMMLTSPRLDTASSPSKSKREQQRRIEGINRILELFPDPNANNTPGYLLKSPSLRITMSKYVPSPKPAQLCRQPSTSLETYHQILHGDEAEFVSRRTRLHVRRAQDP